MMHKVVSPLLILLNLKLVIPALLMLFKTGSTQSGTEASATGDTWAIGSGIGFETGPSTYASGFFTF